MESENNKQQKILSILHEVQNEMDTHPQTVPEHMFQFLEGLSSLVYRWREAHGADGWSLKVVDLPNTQQKVLEGGFQTLNPFFYRNQLGGNWHGGAVGQEEKEEKEEKEDSILEKGFADFIEYVKQVNTQWSEIQGALGIVEAGSGTGAQAEGIISFISLFIEGVRIWILLNPMDSQTYRFFFSISQAVLDGIRGETRQALLSLLGLIDQNGLMISIFGRFMLSLAAIRATDLNQELSLDIYKSTKSTVSFFLLWSFSLFAPESIKERVSTSLAQIYRLGSDPNGNGPNGNGPNGNGPNGNGPNGNNGNNPGIADLQRLHDIFQNKEISCSPRFKELVKPISEVFILRLAFDLADIPTTDSDIASACEAKLRGGAPRVARVVRLARVTRIRKDKKSTATAIATATRKRRHLTQPL